MGIRWLKIISNTELWEATGDKPIILQIRMKKMVMDQSYSEEGE
jgi:hypothetical protein